MGGKGKGKGKGERERECECGEEGSSLVVSCLVIRYKYIVFVE